MGEDFLRRKNETFVRRRDAHFERIIEPDLFSDTHAQERIEVIGRVANGIELVAGDELWASDTSSAKEVRLFRGDQEAVICQGPAAQHLSEEVTTGGTMIAKIMEVEPDDEFVVMTATCVQRSPT